jgi:hypothetical protein
VVCVMVYDCCVLFRRWFPQMWQGNNCPDPRRRVPREDGMHKAREVKQASLDVCREPRYRHEEKKVKSQWV